MERKKTKIDQNEELSNQVASLQSELTEIKKMLLSQSKSLSQLLTKPAESGPESGIFVSS